MKESFKIDFPDDAEINRQIDQIVTVGLPPKKTFIQQLKEMYRQLGFKWLVNGMAEVLFMLLLILAGLVFTAFTAEDFFKTEQGSLQAFVFIASPILYLAACTMSFVNVKQAGLYQIEMTCKYNFFQLAAFRMLIFSLLTLGVNLVFIYLLSVIYSNVGFLSAFLLSATSLFFFSFMALFTIINLRLRLTKIVAAGGWGIANLGFILFSKPLYLHVLDQLPLYVYLLVAAAAGTLYINRLKKLLEYTRTQGVN